MAKDKEVSKKRKREGEAETPTKKKVKKTKEGKEGKTKKEKEPKEDTVTKSDDKAPALGSRYDEQITRVGIIANPMAPKKLNRRLLKAVKESAEGKTLRRGVKEVVKAIRKKEQGFVLIAGDINPIDVITHVPVLCEEAEIPYVFVPSKEELGLAGLTKRPTSVVMVREGAKGPADYKECVDEIKGIPIPASQA